MMGHKSWSHVSVISLYLGVSYFLSFRVYKTDCKQGLWHEWILISCFLNLSYFLFLSLFFFIHFAPHCQPFPQTYLKLVWLHSKSYWNWNFLPFVFSFFFLSIYFFLFRDRMTQYDGLRFRRLFIYIYTA